ncbi:hypothetical protein KNP414_01534 [Paenibacillus mucilaginosus KNP414]|uniref:Uncharacterized protein n=1 Tax=Paenibacillus mucilaginosus (strain KNP414) TaxID=1036673 RepID=F8FNI6_PAEMK|nr:hypothetical protein KNP414_01534 [Paenibacillus mucilaginosus KNP414]
MFLINKKDITAIIAFSKWFVKKAIIRVRKMAVEVLISKLSA